MRRPCSLLFEGLAPNTKDLLAVIALSGFKSDLTGSETDIYGDVKAIA